MNASNPLTPRHFGIYRHRDSEAEPAEVSRLHDEARARKGRRDKREAWAYDDFRLGDVVVGRVGKPSGRTVYCLVEVVDRHHLHISYPWMSARAGTVMVRVLHAEDPVYVDHIFTFGWVDRHGYWSGAVVLAPEVSHEEYHRRFLSGLAPDV